MSQWEKDLIAKQIRAGMSASDIMDAARARDAETAAAVALAAALTDHRLPRNHPFAPDPQTPTACVICALHPSWHEPAPDA